MSNKVFELIPLAIETRGEVIASNVDEFRELVRAALSNINRELGSDEEFGQAELDVKALKGAEDAVRSAKEKALADAEQLQALFSALDETAEEIRAPRLELEKLIAKRKEEVKAELITEAMKRLECAPRLRAGTFGKSLTEAIKGKRTLDSMRKSLEVTVLTHNAMVTKSRAVIDEFVSAQGTDLVMDREDLEVRGPDNVAAELRRRLEMHTAQAEKKRLEAEAAKAKAEVAAMKREAAEASKPPLPPARKIGSIPVGKSALPDTGPPPAEAEWARFRATCLEAFRPLRAAREALQNPANVVKAQQFADALNTAWKEANA